MQNNFRKFIINYWISSNINEEDNTKIQNAIKEVSKGECIIIGGFSHGQWKSLESTRGEDQPFLFRIASLLSKC